MILSYPLLRRLQSVCLGVVLLSASCSPAWARFEPVTCHNSFSQQAEIAEGRKVALTVYKQQPVLPENDPITQYVQQLGARLVQAAPLTPSLSEQWPFNFHVVASQEVNAFALPGGAIFVNLGTIQASETEAQLAGVMAHEISHVILRHSTCNIGKQRSRGLLYSLGALGSAIFLGNGAAGQLAQAGIGFGQNLDFLHMSRDDERQADLLGTDILYNAGYDPRGLPQFFETIRAKYGSGGTQFLSDHPNPGNRTEYVNQEISTLPRRSKNIVTTPEFGRIHELAAHEKTLTPQQIQAGAWRSGGQYAASPGARADGREVIAPSGPQTGATASAAGIPLVRLNRTSLGLTQPLVPIEGQSFRISAPSGWRQSTGENGDVILAPVGGSSSAGFAYGVLIATRSGGGSSLPDFTSAIVRSLGGNGGLTPTTQVSAMTVADWPAESVDLRGSSPVRKNGQQLAEHDWLVTISRPDGNLTYLVFVAPEDDFASLQPLFSRMLATLQF